MISTDVQKLSPDALVDLFELDATAIGGEVLRWANDVNELGNDIVWQGNTYSRYPIEAQGFEKQGSGKQPRPTLKAANAMGLLGALARSLDDLLGAKVTRRRTFVKYLDAVNFEGGVNPQADPLVSLGDEVWFVDRKAGENGIYIEFELASALDLSGVMLPRRQCIQNVCTWRYRSAECGYAGGAVADAKDNPTNDIAKDVCGKRIASCRLRFGINSPLPYGGFPGISLS